MSDDDDDSVPILMPQLTSAPEPAEVAQWHVRSGDFVAADDIVVDLAIDKMNVDLQAPASGILEVAVPVDTVVNPGDVLARIRPAPPVDPAQVAQHLELLAAVAAAPPDDHATRMAYAQFLVGTAAPLPPWGPSTTRQRGEYLIAQLTRHARPLPGNWRDLDEVIRRLAPVGNGSALSLVVGAAKADAGFVTEVSLPLATFVERHAEFIGRAVLTGVSLRDLEPALVEHLEALPALPYLRSLTLTVPRHSFSGELVERVLRAPIFATATSYRITS